MTTKLQYYIILLVLTILFSQCNEKKGCVSDNTTQSQTGENIALAKSIANQWISQHPPESLAWNWEPAVLMFAITKLYNYTGDTKYFEYYKNWIDYYIDKGYFLMMSDQVIPSAMAADLYRRTCDEKYHLVIDDVYIYLTEEAPRTPEGGISHLGTLVPASPQLWIDSLFMFGMPMINAYVSTGDKKYIDLIFEQMIIFADILHDKDEGLFRHAWINQKLVPEEPAFWARGNSWIVVSLTELLSILLEGYKHIEKLEEIYFSLLNAVEKYQDETSGLWFTVLNRPGETYLETSASALFCYGILKGINEGILDKNAHSTIVERGLNGVKSRIDYSSGEPVVTGISKGTQPGGFDNYNEVGVGNDIHYGVGAVILALVEYQRFLNE